MAQGTGTNRNCLQMMPGAMAFHEPGTAVGTVVGAVLICFRNTLLILCRTHFASDLSGPGGSAIAHAFSRSFDVNLVGAFFETTICVFKHSSLLGPPVAAFNKPSNCKQQHWSKPKRDCLDCPYGNTCHHIASQLCALFLRACRCKKKVGEFLEPTEASPKTNRFLGLWKLDPQVPWIKTWFS